MFPNLSMLDVSNNNLKEIPANIYDLSNLSVLNISGNLGMYCCVISFYKYIFRSSTVLFILFCNIYVSK